MPENFNDVTDAFAGWLQALTGTRTSGSYVLGRWADGTPVALSLDAVVQNATAEDLLVLEEGNRTSEALKLHTTTKLYPVSGGAYKDQITYDGVTWTVYSVADRKIGGYYKAIAIKDD